MTPIIVKYRPDLHIANLSQLPRGTRAKYLECVMSHSGLLVAKQWRNTIPKEGDIIVTFGR